MSTEWWTRAVEARGIRFVGHHGLAGFGDGNQLLRQGDHLYVGHMRRTGTSVLDVSDPERPELVWQQPAPANTHSHKVQIGDGLLIVNHEQLPEDHGPGTGARGAHSAGIQIYDIATNPAEPRPVGFMGIGGKGVHRLWYTGGPYAYLSGQAEGFRERMLTVADLSEPSAPRALGRWWVPGLWAAGGEEPTWPEGTAFGMHHATVHGSRAYAGLLDAGIGIIDISDPSSLRLVSRLTWEGDWGGFAHTVLCLPERRLLAVTQEQTEPDCTGPARYVRLVDASDEEHLQPLGILPEPQGDYCTRGGRFGPHNLHENPLGVVREDRLYVTYFNAGLRVYDIEDASNPREVAWYVPEPPPGQGACQINDVFVDDTFIYITDRINGGVWVLQEG
ncbi:MAG: hypothetical protein HYX52_01260 [Chloroflexi bacterium]|nr:hypothetical protein [Chloroflexota bacterium]